MTTRKKPDIIVSYSPHSAIWQFTPVSRAAEEFLANECEFEDWQTLAGTYAVDHRPARDFAVFLADQGFNVFHPDYGFLKPQG